MPPATTHMGGQKNGFPDDSTYPSRNIAFQAAGMITSIIENLSAHDELRYCPAFIVYSLFSALIMHVYQMRSSIPSIVTATQERLQVCMNALKDVSKVWLVAKMVHTLFESILGNKVLEERLQKAAGKRHNKTHRHTAQASISKRGENPTQSEPSKRKFDDMELGFSNGPPAPQVSYERSRPQTPAVTPSRDLGQPPLMAAPPNNTSPALRTSADAYMGAGSSRSNTRPPTPFNPSFSVPATPPDLFLVTRNSPPISQSLFENFQPDQLFPEGTGANISVPSWNASPNQQIDPTITQQRTPAGIGMSQQGLVQQMQLNQQQMQQQQQQNQASKLPGGPQSPMQGMQGGVGTLGYGWPNQFDTGFGGMTGGDMGSPEDSWSNSSKGQAAVPTTLNVEDW